MSATTARPRRGNRRAHVALAAVMLEVLVFSLGLALYFSGSGSSPARIGGPFSLIDGDGRPVTDRDYRGQYVLLYFGYTFCPDICPTTLNEVAVAMRDLGANAGRVRPLFITVDPERDRPQAVKEYAAAFYPRMVGLTGTVAQVARVAREYRVSYAAHRTGPDAGDYTVDHSSLLYLVGPDGRFLAPIRADEPGAAIAADIAEHFY